VVLSAIKLLAYDVVVSSIVLIFTSVLSSALNNWAQPRSFPCLSGIGLDIGLVVVALASFSGSGVWSHLTSLGD